MSPASVTPYLTLHRILDDLGAPCHRRGIVLTEANVQAIADVHAGKRDVFLRAVRAQTARDD